MSTFFLISKQQTVKSNQPEGNQVQESTDASSKAPAVCCLLTAVCFLWCERGDSNPHTFRYQILSLARLPIPPLSRWRSHDQQSRGAKKNITCTLSHHNASGWGLVQSYPQITQIQFREGRTELIDAFKFLICVSCVICG